MTTITKQQTEKYRKVFEIFDEDKSGEISTKELKKALEQAGLILTKAEITTLVRKLDKDTNGMISLEEFLTIIHEREELTILSDFVDDMSALQKAFLSKLDTDHSDDLEDCVKELRTCVSKITSEQIKILASLHYNHLTSYIKYQEMTKKSLEVRKVLSEGNVKPLLCESWGKPALGGFFAEKRSTIGLTAKEIVIQLGLDYTDSPYLDKNGNIVPLVYLLEGDMEVGKGTKVPLDPRIRGKLLSIAEEEQDEKIKNRLKSLHERSCDCAVDDGSEIAKEAKMKVSRPYTGTGFALSGESLDKEGLELKFVEEHVAIDDKFASHFIPFPIGAKILVQGDQEELFCIAKWNGSDWVLSAKNESDLPKWFVQKSGKTAQEILKTYNEYIETGKKTGYK